VKVLQSRLFEQRVRKFSKEQKLILDEQINLLIENPEFGTEKKGDLKEVFIHKFKIKTIQYLLAYRFNEEKIELIMIGPHQNYYRDLKRYLKKK